MRTHLAPVVLLVLALFVASADVAWASQPAATNITFEVTGADVQRAAGRKPWFDCCELPCWDIEAAVPIWIPGVSGTFGSGTISVEGDGSVGDAAADLFEDAGALQFAFVGAVGVRHERWRFILDGFGANLSQTITFKLTDNTVLDGELGAVILRARLAYELNRRPFCLFGRKACLTSAAYVGARYYHVGFEFDLPLGARVDRSSDWFDPLVGLDVELQWDRWGLRLGSDIGGFGVNSDFSFWLTGEIEYRFNRWFSIAAGYAVLDVDFSEGVGAHRFEWNITLTGPIVGLRFRF